MKAKKQSLTESGGNAIAKREGARRKVVKIVDDLADPGFFTVAPELFYTVEDFEREVRELWEVAEGLRGTIPGAAAAEAEARRRGRVFDDLAKRNIERLLLDFEKFYDLSAKATGDDGGSEERGAWSEDLFGLRNELCARWLFVIQRCCAALETLAKDAGDAGHLARAAICAFRNIPGTGEGRREAIRAALAEADGAARAYFVEHWKCDGKPQRRHTPKELVKAGRGILAKMGLKPNRSGQIEGLQTAEVKAKFGRRLMDAGLWTDADDADLPGKILESIYDADRRAAQRKRKPH